VFGAVVVLADGAPAMYLERGGRGLLSFPSTDERVRDAALEALAGWVLADRRRRVAIERVDGEPVFGSPLEAPLAAAGFRADLRAMVLRA
jgi:ATP-dependent Lhr-like helicase